MNTEIEHSGLTAAQTVWVHSILSGVGISAAAADAGYTPASRRPWAIAQLPAVKRALQDGIDGKLLVAASAAAEYLAHAAAGTGPADRHRIDACRTVLDRAGFAAIRGAESRGGVPALAEMSRDQLAAIVQQAQRALSDRATPIIDNTDSAPVDAPEAAEMADLLG